MNCPDKDCHDQVTRLSTFMKIVGSSVAVLLTAIITISLYAMAAEKVQNDKISEVKVVKESIKRIDGNIQDIKSQMNEQKHDTDAKLNDIKELIRSLSRDVRRSRGDK